MGPDTPSFRYRATHPPASYTSDLKVRSDHPEVVIENKQKDWVNSKGMTKINTWDGAKLVHNTGKGGVDFKFNSGKRAFNVLHANVHNANFDQTKVSVGGGTPLAVDSKHLFNTYTNSTGAFALGDGPKFNNAWNVTGGPADVSTLAAAGLAVGAGLAGGLPGPLAHLGGDHNGR